MFYFVISFSVLNVFYCYTSHLLFYATVLVLLYTTTAVSASSSLVVLTVFIDTLTILYYLYLSK